METYTELCSKMLKQFRSLLRHNPSVFGKQQLVQMMAINMYEVEVAKQVKNSGKLDIFYLNFVLFVSLLHSGFRCSISI